MGSISNSNLRNYSYGSCFICASYEDVNWKECEYHTVTGGHFVERDLSVTGNNFLAGSVGNCQLL
jgi:hypothetical protein